MPLNTDAVKTAIGTALQADATLQSLIGNPIRLSAFVDRSNSFPFVRVDYLGMPYLTGTRKGPGIRWIDRMAIGFTAFAKETSLTTVDNIKDAIYEIMEDAPAMSVTGGAIGMSLPVNQFSRYEHKDGTAVSYCEFVLSIEDTT